MKRFILSVMFVAATLIAVAESRTDKLLRELNNPKSEYVFVVAHRADWRNFPENSLEAIESSIQIGVAVWHKDNCLANKGEKCDNCARHCPVGAIAMIDYEGKRIPTVNAEMCIGCGACENLCPSRPLSGMCIEGVEEHRVL